MNAKIVYKDRMDIHFMAESETEITPELAKKAQIDLGYPVMGYSFYSFQAYAPLTGFYTATWLCSASCD
jgi:hypothetical protein